MNATTNFPDDLDGKFRLAKLFEENGFEVSAIMTWRDMSRCHPLEMVIQSKLSEALERWKRKYPILEVSKGLS